MKTVSLIFLLTWSFISSSQNVDYNDVAVIVNDNSQTSIDIANYFQSARNIPNQNMIHITGPTTEAIDSLEFELIRAQIEAYLLNNNLADSINYIVTTKGVPLKITGGCFNPPPGPSQIACASFDSELCLILGQHANLIGQSGGFNNPMYDSFQHFSHSATDVYLVTRLTGYTTQDVYDLIDRSGYETGVNQAGGQVVLDLNDATGVDSAFFHDVLITPADDYLTTNFWNSQVDLNNDPLLNQSNVFAYSYFGHGPFSNVSLGYNWALGSIGLMATAGTAQTFDAAQNTTGELLLGNLISEGCTGGMGYVNTTFFSLIFKSAIAYNRYLDIANDYNFAESMYMAEARMSWQAVIVGDPKASLRLDNTASANDFEELTLRTHPNPTQGIIRFESKELITTVKIYSANGVLVKSLEGAFSNQVELDLSNLNGGVYLAHIYSDEKMKVERIVLAK